jgi:hypothetical protein
VETFKISIEMLQTRDSHQQLKLTDSAGKFNRSMLY